MADPQHPETSPITKPTPSQRALAGEETVDENELAAMIGLPASAVRAMMSGEVAIPSDLVGVIPEPTRVTNLVWRREDAIAAAERYRENAEERRQEEAAAQQREQDVYAAQRARRQERERAAAEFATEREHFDELLEQRMPVAGDPDKKGFFAAIVDAMRMLFEKDDAPDTTAVTLAPDGSEIVTPESRTSRLVADSRRERADKHDRRIHRGAVSHFEADAESDEKGAARAQARAEKDRARAEMAEEKAAAKEQARAEKEQARAAKAAQKEQSQSERDRIRKEKELAKLTAQDERRAAQNAKAEAAKAKRALAAEQKAAAKDAKNAAKEAQKAAKSGAKALASATADDKKMHKAESKRARSEALARYKAALTKWREDAKIAKANGVKPPKKPKKPKFSTSKPKPMDVIGAVRAFAMMLDNAPGELDSLETMLHEYEGSQIGEAFRRIHFRIAEQNATLVEAFAPEKIFPAEIHNMLQVGAKTASAGDALRTAVKLLDSQNDNKRNLVGEIGEPVLVGLLSLAALFATAWVVMPSFLDMYESLEMPVPPVSAAILTMSDVTGWVLMIIAGAAALYAAWWFALGRRNDRWRTALDAYKLHMPLMGKANMTAETSHTIKVLNAYMSAGAPEREALADAAEASGNRAIRKHLETTAELMLQGRATFADVFDTDLFPNMVRNIIATGEKSGRILEMLETLDETYEREADVEAKAAVRRVSGTIAGVSSLIFTVVVTMVTVPPLEMFGSTLSYGQ